MSAPLKLDADDLTKLGKFLGELSKLACTTGVYLTQFAPITVSIGDNHGLEAVWDEDAMQYVIDDRVGS